MQQVEYGRHVQRCFHSISQPVQFRAQAVGCFLRWRQTRLMPLAAQKCMAKGILVKKAVQITAPYAGAPPRIAPPPAQGPALGVVHHDTHDGRRGIARS